MAVRKSIPQSSYGTFVVCRSGLTRQLSLLSVFVGCGKWKTSRAIAAMQRRRAKLLFVWLCIGAALSMNEFEGVEESMSLTESTDNLASVIKPKYSEIPDMLMSLGSKAALVASRGECEETCNKGLPNPHFASLFKSLPPSSPVVSFMVLQRQVARATAGATKRASVSGPREKFITITAS